MVLLGTFPIYSLVTLEIFLYVLDNIFIVNLKKFFLIFGDTLFMNFKVKVKVTRSST